MLAVLSPFECGCWYCGVCLSEEYVVVTSLARSLILSFYSRKIYLGNCLFKMFCFLNHCCYRIDK